MLYSKHCVAVAQVAKTVGAPSMEAFRALGSLSWEIVGQPRAAGLGLDDL